MVDPGEAAPVLAKLQQDNLELELILITHHHQDHVGGVAELLRHYPKAKVIGPSQDPVLMLTQSVQGGDRIDIFGETFLVMDVPGHTLGHIAYVGDGKLFCGDVLFSAGCGRVFEGTYEQMFHSLQNWRLYLKKPKSFVPMNTPHPTLPLHLLSSPIMHNFMNIEMK